MGMEVKGGEEVEKPSILRWESGVQNSFFFYTEGQKQMDRLHLHIFDECLPTNSSSFWHTKEVVITHIAFFSYGEYF